MKRLLGVGFGAGLALWLSMGAGCLDVDDSHERELAACLRFCERLLECRLEPEGAWEDAENCRAVCERQSPDSLWKPDPEMIACADEPHCTAFAACVESRRFDGEPKKAS